MTKPQNEQEARAKLWELIQDMKIAVLVTRDKEGNLRGRPMAAVRREEFDGVLWFFTSAGSPKLQEIAHDPQVLLSYSDPRHQHYVSVRGHAERVDDRAKIKECWSEPMRAWFPKGSDDPEIALLKVTAEGAEYWDSPSSAAVYLYGYVKAALTGERPDPGENAKISF